MRDLGVLLNERKQRSAYRERLCVDSAPGRWVVLEGRPFLNFCSNDYLGLADHPEVKQSFKQGLDRYGCGSGASQLVCGYSRAHQLLEQELAEFVQMPRALLFSTGYQANLGVLGLLLPKHSIVYEDRLNHASLIDGARLAQAELQRYHHADSVDLERRLCAASGQELVLASDGVFSMDGDLAPLQSLSALAQKYQAWLVLDDAHGLGVLGATGRGLIEQCGLNSTAVSVLVGTFGKAFGTFGAFVAGGDDVIESLIQSARSLIYTTASPAALAEATRTSLALIQRDSWRRDKLLANIAYLHERFAAHSWIVPNSTTAIQPIVIGSDALAVKFSRYLYDHGIILTAIRPPTVPVGTARLRITLSAVHEFADIDQLVAVLDQAFARADQWT